jgi:hypothetical protein
MHPRDGRRGGRRLRSIGAAWVVAALAGLIAASPASSGEPLRPGDVPPGWVSVGGAPARLFAGVCGLRPRPKASRVLHTRYRDPASALIADSTWHEFTTAERARRRLAAIRRTIRSCRVYDFTFDDGDETLITLEPSGAPDVGNDAVAYQREIYAAASTPGIRSVVVRVGRRLTTVHLLDLALPPTELVDALAARAAARA